MNIGLVLTEPGGVGVATGGLLHPPPCLFQHRQSGQWGCNRYRPGQNEPNIDQISTTQHYIDQNIDHKSSLKGAYLQHYTFCDQKVHAHFGRTVIYPISHFHFLKFNTLKS